METSAITSNVILWHDLNEQAFIPSVHSGKVVKPKPWVLFDTVILEQSVIAGCGILASTGHVAPGILPRKRLGLHELVR